jgi:hypothetical protein
LIEVLIYVFADSGYALFVAIDGGLLVLVMMRWLLGCRFNHFCFRCNASSRLLQLVS